MSYTAYKKICVKKFTQLRAIDQKMDCDKLAPTPCALTWFWQSVPVRVNMLDKVTSNFLGKGESKPTTAELIWTESLIPCIIIGRNK